IPPIPWHANGWYWVFALLTECEKSENRKVLFAVSTAVQDIQGETKNAVFRRIGQTLFPEYYKQDSGTLTNRIRAQIESLTSMYREHSKWLKVTGGGKGGNDESPVEQDVYLSGWYIH
ncbi:hypothetical protein PUNSTDRAFT_78426, partial [Punctularia strigosozonata HHB-11173 SS5]